VKGLRRIEVAGAVFPVNDFYRIEATRVAVTVRTGFCITAESQYHRARCYEDLQHSAQTYVNRRHRGNSNYWGAGDYRGYISM
jgi:hypothetical protein